MSTEFVGTLPAWISTGSVVIAALTYWHNSQERDREQAAKIAAWLSENAGGETCSITISNFSDSPAFDVYLVYSGYALELAELSPRSYLVGPLGGRLTYYAAGVELADEIYEMKRIAVAGTVRGSKSSDRPALAFKDAVGREWISKNGSPRRRRAHHKLIARPGLQNRAS